MEPTLNIFGNWDPKTQQHAWEAAREFQQAVKDLMDAIHLRDLPAFFRLAENELNNGLAEYFLRRQHDQMKRLQDRENEE